MPTLCDRSSRLHWQEDLGGAQVLPEEKGIHGPSKSERISGRKRCYTARGGLGGDDESAGRLWCIFHQDYGEATRYSSPVSDGPRSQEIMKAAKSPQCIYRTWPWAAASSATAQFYGSGSSNQMTYKVETTSYHLVQSCVMSTLPGHFCQHLGFNESECPIKPFSPNKQYVSPQSSSVE